MIKIYYRNLREHEIHKLKEYRVGSWTHVESPNDNDFEYLVKKHRLDEGILKDSIDQYEVPRTEVKDGVVYIFSRYPLRQNGHIITSPILFIIQDSHILTITKETFPILELALKNNSIFTTQKTKLILQLFTLINEAYNLHLLSISRETRSSSYKLEKIRNKDIAMFVGYEQVLNDFHLALVRTNAVLNNLMSTSSLKLYEEDREILEDLLLNNEQFIQLSKENLKSIVNIRDAYSTIMTNNTNRVVKLFTSLTVILTIPTIIASIYGMNIALPYQNSPFAFFGIMVSTVLIALGLVLIFLKNDWL